MTWFWRKLGLTQRITITHDEDLSEMVLDIGPVELFRLTVYVMRNHVRPNEGVGSKAVNELVIKEALRRRGFRPGVL